MSHSHEGQAITDNINHLQTPAGEPFLRDAEGFLRDDEEFLRDAELGFLRDDSGSLHGNYERPEPPSPPATPPYTTLASMGLPDPAPSLWNQYEPDLRWMAPPQISTGTLSYEMISNLPYEYEEPTRTPSYEAPSEMLGRTMVPAVLLDATLEPLINDRPLSADSPLIADISITADRPLIAITADRPLIDDVPSQREPPKCVNDVEPEGKLIIQPYL